MFRRAHDEHYKDLSLDLRDEVDWQVKTLRELDFPRDASVTALDSCSGLLAVASQGYIHLFGRPGVECLIPVPDRNKLKILLFALSVYKLIAVDVQNRLHVWDLTTIGKPKLLTSVRFDPIIALALSPSHTHVCQVAISASSGILDTLPRHLLHSKPVWSSPST
jgi:syntaxin-binding protein 5